MAEQSPTKPKPTLDRLAAVDLMCSNFDLNNAESPLSEKLSMHRSWLQLAAGSLTNDKPARFRPSKKDGSRVTIKDEDLKGADFSNFKLVQWTFVNCDLRHSDFSNAVLMDVRFENCKTEGATFSGAVY